MKKSSLLPLAALLALGAAGLAACGGTSSAPASEPASSSVAPTYVDITKLTVTNLETIIADWHMGDGPRAIDLATEPEVNILAYLNAGKIVISSDNPDIVAVNGLLLTPLKEGETVIRISAGDTRTSFTITIQPAKLTYATVAETLEEVKDLEQGKTKNNIRTVGMVSEITTAYSDQYKNVSFKITDPGTGNELLCYRAAAGEGIDTLGDVKIGDFVKLTGNITNYQGTIEYAAGAQVTFHNPMRSVAGTLKEIESLESGKSVQFYSTSGIISEITSEWSDQYKNISFNIKDAEGEGALLCYRAVCMEGIDGSALKVGDKVSIAGTIKNYNGTLEYDAKSVIFSYVAAN